MSQPTLKEINKIAESTFGKYFERTKSTDRILSAICNNDVTAIHGPSCSSKTVCAALYGFCAYAASPSDTTVAVLGESLSVIKKRFWANITQMFRAAQEAGIIAPVNVRPSNCSISPEFGRSLSGAFASAKPANIVGVKNKNVILIIEDYGNGLIAQLVAECVWANPNVKIIVTGNPGDNRDDAISILSKPIGGWAAMRGKKDQWTTDPGVGNAKGVAVYAYAHGDLMRRATERALKTLGRENKSFRKYHIGRFE